MPKLSKPQLEKLFKYFKLKSVKNYNKDYKTLLLLLESANYTEKRDVVSIKKYFRKNKLPHLKIPEAPKIIIPTQKYIPPEPKEQVKYIDTVDPDNILFKKIKYEKDIRKLKKDIKSEKKLQYKNEALKEAKELENIRTQLKNILNVINSIDNTPLPKEHWKSLTNSRKDGINKIKINGRHFNINFKGLDDQNKKYLYKKFGSLMLTFFKKVDLGTTWFVQYKFNDGWKSIILDYNSVQNLYHQLVREGFIDDMELNLADLSESEYDFFPVNIREIEELIFQDETDFDKQFQESNIKTSQYETNGGKFWRWLCNIDELDLSRYQIFNKINENTIKLMSEENCIVYACRQAGVDEDTLNFIKENMTTRFFPESKLNYFSEMCNISFYVKHFDKKSSKTHLKKFEQPNPKYTIKLLCMFEHYLLDEKVPINTFYIRHYNEIENKYKNNELWDNERKMRIYKYDDKKNCFKTNKELSNISDIIKALFEVDGFKPIYLGDFLYSSTLYKEKVEPIKNLYYSAKYCCRLKAENIKKSSKNRFIREHVIYADFECSTDGIHEEYCICAMIPKTDKLSDIYFKEFGTSCAYKFLDWIPNNSVVYFHNLSYDINFILNKVSKVCGIPIIKQNRVYQMETIYRKKKIIFKDSYSVINKKLKMFPIMFKLNSGEKEVFPYAYYTKSLLKNDNNIGIISEAKKFIKSDEHDQFEKNINLIKNCRIDDNHFYLDVYALFYCEQDVRILMLGFEQFRKDLKNIFDIEVYDFVSLSSIANRIMEKNIYWKNGNLYDLAGVPREFISKCVEGGRCMTNSNKIMTNDSSITNKAIVDFDAVSLYPSAVKRLYCLEGMPEVLEDEMLNTNYLLDHLFEENQKSPTNDRFISGFFVEIEIINIGINRDFPLIIYNSKIQDEPDINVKRNSNVCCKMYVDHIKFQDLIKFQKCDINVIRGYYYKDNRDYSIQNVINEVFQLRLQYKIEENPAQELIKLVLNSIYGKTLLKPIDTKTVFKYKSEAKKFRIKNNNMISEIRNLYNSKFIKFKVIKPIHKHYNFCSLGVNILSMSKRIMNEVFCTAEDLRMKIFYQDTDSLMLFRKDLDVVENQFEKIYDRKLIGKELGQFHCDFPEIVAKGGMPEAVKSIFVGKKIYLNQLRDKNNNIAFMCRWKGITQEIIGITANQMFSDSIPVKYNEDTCLFYPEYNDLNSSKYSIFELYKHRSEGNKIKFDLCASDKPVFDMGKDFSVKTKEHFYRSA